MARILSHPLRLGPGGQFVTVEQNSDAGVAEQLAIFLLTKQQERALCPGFGVTDPTFADVDTDAVNLGLALYGPPVQITDLTTALDATGAATVEVTYEQ